jgi:hypothetical protein
LVSDALLFPAREDEFVQGLDFIGVLHESGEGMNAAARFLCAGFEQIEKNVFATE